MCKPQILNQINGNRTISNEWRQYVNKSVINIEILAMNKKKPDQILFKL